MTPPVPIHVPALNLHGILVAVVPSSTPGGETQYRCGWREAHNTMPREAGFWLEDFDDDTRARLAVSVNGVAAQIQAA